MDFSYVKRNYDELSGEISYLCTKYSSAPVTLVSVTKSATDGEVIELCRSGAYDIGENRPQMLMARHELLSSAGLFPNFHAIGSIQRNKARTVVGLSSLIHSLDSIRLAEALNKEAQKCAKTVSVLIEINSAEEEAKGGILPRDAERFFIEMKKFESLSVAGIMTMGPVCERPEDIRPYFRLTKNIYDDINSRYGFSGGGILSMGMSDSYRIAIEEGSTLVRVGRRLFIK